jgi:acyl-CoA dehydrogenase
MTPDAMTAHDLAIALRPEPDLVEMLGDLFSDYRTRRAVAHENVELDADLWAQLDGLGLTRLTGAEDRGGSGASWVEASVLLGAAAGASAPLPLAEHDLLAGWLLEVADLPASAAVTTVCQPDRTGVATAVPWARSVASIVALWKSPDGWRVCDVPAARVSLSEARNLAGEPCDTVHLDVADLGTGVLVGDGVAAQYRLRGALARCAQVVGAMERVVDVVRGHVNERKQFGRPIGRFQAVQALVADLASEAALARAASDAAVARVVAAGWTDSTVPFLVGVAKSCVGHAASVVVRNAHQAVGAIGATLEHELPSLTKPILVWRSDFGSVTEWDSMVTELAIAAGRDGLWSFLTSPGGLSDTPSGPRQQGEADSV